jgi:hypothetical protein
MQPFSLQSGILFFMDFLELMGSVICHWKKDIRDSILSALDALRSSDIPVELWLKYLFNK